MKLTKFHKILKFKQSHWLKKYIDFNTKIKKNRKITADSFEKYFSKLMINCVYDKTREHLRQCYIS